jgi:hypothetical protein
MSIASVTILFAGLGTLGIFSFLIGENRFYRFFEYLFIGVAAGSVPLVTFKTFLWPQILEPMFGMGSVVLPDGTIVGEPSIVHPLWFLIPICFGLLYYTIYIPRFRWIAGVVIAFSLGASAGLTFQGFFAEVVPQILKSFQADLLFASILLATMYYFFFTFQRAPRGAGAVVAWYGRTWMMVCFGAFFGSTIMARLALLIERLQFLVSSWYPEIIRTIGGLYGS